MIYVIGLGNKEGNLPQNVIETINKCGTVIVKTAMCRSYQSVLKNGFPHITFDSIFNKSKNFDTLNKNIVKEILKLSKQSNNIAYLVDGSGYEDSSVMLLFDKAKEIEILPSSGKADILSCCPSLSYTVFSAIDFINTNYPEFCKEFPLVIYEADKNLIAGDLKLKLFKFYGEQTQIMMSNGKEIKKIMLYEMDRQQDYGYQTTFLIPPQSILEQSCFTFGDLFKIMERLRGEGGCPWDKEQTHASIKMNAVEESYELIEAIDKNDTKAMEEETGDVLLQAVFQSCIAKDYAEFDIYDVLSTLCKKLIFRHSHIFGSDVAVKSADALVHWEKNKSIEKGQDTFAKSLRDVAKTFPSITRAEKVQKRAAKCGFEFEHIQSVFDKIEEETNELKEAIKAEDKTEIFKEAGDLLFSAVNLARRLKIDGELALNGSTDKFIKRFEYMENKILKTGKTLSEVTLDEMEKYYTESKHAD